MHNKTQFTRDSGLMKIRQAVVINRYELFNSFNIQNITYVHIVYYAMPKSPSRQLLVEKKLKRNGKYFVNKEIHFCPKCSLFSCTHKRLKKYYLLKYRVQKHRVCESNEISSFLTAV
jgi:hypothetical protein